MSDTDADSASTPVMHYGDMHLVTEEDCVPTSTGYTPTSPMYDPSTPYESPEAAYSREHGDGNTHCYCPEVPPCDPT